MAKADLVPLNRHAHGTVLPELNRHAGRVAADTPERMAAAAHAAGGWNREAGSLAVAPAVPLVPDAPADWTRSQAVRAASPWLAHWRTPVTTFADRHLPLAGYAALTAEWSDRLLVELARRAAADAPTLVLADRPAGGDKGDEPWTRRADTALADERFAVLGLARRAAVPTFGRPLLVRPRPAGVVGFAEVLSVEPQPADAGRHPARLSAGGRLGHAQLGRPGARTGVGRPGRPAPRRPRLGGAGGAGDAGAVTPGRRPPGLARRPGPVRHPLTGDLS